MTSTAGFYTDGPWKGHMTMFLLSSDIPQVIRAMVGCISKSIEPTPWVPGYWSLVVAVSQAKTILLTLHRALNGKMS